MSRTRKKFNGIIKKGEKMKKRILSLVLCVAMIITGVQPVFATTDFAPADDQLVYSAIGDSIVAGYGVKGADYDTMFVTENYYQSADLSYTNVVKRGIDADIAYNLGTLGAWAKDFPKFLTDPDFDDSVAASFGDVDHMLHHLLLATLKKSDVISIELGGNDIMQGIVLHDLVELAATDEQIEEVYKYIAAKEYGIDYPLPEINNPAALCACVVLAVGVIGGLDNVGYGLGIATMLLQPFADQIDQDDLKELAAFFEPKSFSEKVNKYGEEVAQAYRDLIELLENGKEITAEEYTSLLEHYAKCEEIYEEENGEPASDYVDPADKELGKMSDLELIKEGQLSLKECYDYCTHQMRYYIEPINPNAKIMLVGTYNPYGSSYIFKMKDAKEVGEFVMGIVDTLMNLNSGEDFDIEEAFEAFSDIPDAIIYGALGFPMQHNFAHFNSLISDIAKEYNAKNFVCGKFVPKYDVQYVSIIDLVSNGKEDIHPNAMGHNFIGKQIIDKYFGTQAAAAVNNETYATLEEAIAAANDGDTVLLLRNVCENVTVGEEKEFFIDRNGYCFKGCISAEEGFKNVGIFNYYKFVDLTEPIPDPEPQPVPPEPTPIVPDDTPETGDMGVLPYMLVLAIALEGAAIAYSRKRREN